MYLHNKLLPVDIVLVILALPDNSGGLVGVMTAESLQKSKYSLH